MTSEITKFKRYLCFLSQEEKLREVKKYIEGLSIDKHQYKDVKDKYRILEELKLIKSQSLRK